MAPRKKRCKARLGVNERRRKKGKKTGRAIIKRAQATKLGCRSDKFPFKRPNEKAQIKEAMIKYNMKTHNILCEKK